MEQFKKKLMAQNKNTIIGIIIWFVICVAGIVCEAGDFLIPITGDSHWASKWHGFISGVSFAFLVLMIVSLIQGIRAVKDEKALKKLYIAETDERNIHITTSAQASSMKAFLILGLAAGIIAGYFSMTVSVTILACVVIHSCIGIGFKVYYSKKL
ncbi:MAG: hypothetical protein IJ001_07795 [Oscillospiraceae bacterium]|nr:hypothetical protein [Oscillospiraceae bacterium]